MNIPKPGFIFSMMIGTFALLACDDNLGPEPVQEGEAAGQAVVSAKGAATDYEVFPMGNALGGTNGFARGINNRNEVVGMARNAEGEFRAFRWSAGTMEELEGLGGSVSGAYAINSGGLIVGEAEDPDGNLRAVVWRDGEAVDLGTLGGTMSQALAVNERGQVVGMSHNADSEPRPFLWSRGRMQELPIPPGAEFFISATGINNRGEVVGTGVIGTQKALFWSHGDVVVLETTCIEAGAQGINARGQIVGGGLGCTISPMEVVPLLWNGDQPARHLEPLGGLQEIVHGMQNVGAASAINSRGHIVGWSDAAPSVLEREQRATLWYRDQVIDLGGEPDFPSAVAINEQGVAAGRSALEPALFVPASKTDLVADLIDDGVGATFEMVPHAPVDDLAGSRAGEDWAVSFCAGKGGVSGPPTVAGHLAGC